MFDKRKKIQQKINKLNIIYIHGGDIGTQTQLLDIIFGTFCINKEKNEMLNIQIGLIGISPIIETCTLKQI